MNSLQNANKYLIVFLSQVEIVMAVTLVWNLGALTDIYVLEQIQIDLLNMWLPLSHFEANVE